MDISVLYIIPNDRIIETVQRVMQRCDVNYPVYYGTMSGALEIAKRMIAQGSRVIAVSYTHLDVYKRQAADSRCNCPWPPSGRAASSASRSSPAHP